MIDRINREFDILSAQKKRLQKLQQEFTIVSSLYGSYMTTVKSVSMVAFNIAESFTEILTPVQVKLINKTYSQLVNVLVQKLHEHHEAFLKIKGEKQQVINKNKNQNCAICGENIHESNIRQAKIGLQEESKQNFHLAMQQFKKIAEEPIFTKEENNDFEERLHYLLSQREKVLNMNCNRIEEFVEIMDSTLADLMKLKEIQLNEGQNQRTVDFVTANKIGEDVSSFLQQSFSRKIPPWIHKMFLKMMTCYIQQMNSKKMQKSIQTIPYESVDSKDVREMFRQKQILQKQNKQMADQIVQLKACNKRFEQLYMENMKTILSLNRNLRAKPTVVYKQAASKSRRNSKNSKYIRQQDQTPRDSNENAQESQEVIQYSVYEDESFLKSNRNFSRKKKTQVNIFPQIKKHKYQGRNEIKDHEIRSTSELKHQKQQQKKKSTIIDQEQANKQNIIESKKQVNSNQKSQLHKEIGSKTELKTAKKKNKDVHTTQIDKKEKVTNQSKSKFRQKEQSNNQQSKRGSLRNYNSILIQDQIKTNLHEKKSQKVGLKKEKATKRVKVNISNLQNKNSGDTIPIKAQQDSSLRQLYDYIANIKLTKKDRKDQNEPNGANDEQEQGQDKVFDDTCQDIPGEKTGQNKKEASGVQQKQNLQSYNKKNHEKQMKLMKKISKDLTDQVKNKTNSLYNAIYGGTDAQIIKNSKRRIEEHQIREEDSEKKNLIEENHGRQYKNQREELYDTEYEQDKYEQQYEQDFEETNRKSDQCDNKTKELVSKNAKLRNSENTYLFKRQKSKHFTNFNKQNSQIKSHNLSASLNSKETQRKIFQVLKSHNILEKSVDYNIFSSLIQTIDPQQREISKEYHNDRSSIDNNSRRDYASSRKQSIAEQIPQNIEDLAHNSVYGRLFLTKAVAFKYQESMTKSYHKKVLRQLTQVQHKYCFEMYGQLCDTKKASKQVYHEFCSILRYPYQTLYNNFEVVNFMSQMSYETFEFFFRKLIGIHRKCPQDGKNGVCHHIQSVREELQTFIGQINLLKK